MVQRWQKKQRQRSWVISQTSEYQMSLWKNSRVSVQHFELAAFCFLFENIITVHFLLVLKEASLFTYLSTVHMIGIWKKICVEYRMYCSFTILFYRAKCELFVSHTIQDVWSCLQWRRCNWSSTYVYLICSTILTLYLSLKQISLAHSTYFKDVKDERLVNVYNICIICIFETVLFSVGTGTGKTVSKTVQHVKNL